MDENFHWDLNFAISLMAISLNLNSVFIFSSSRLLPIMTTRV